MNHLVIFTEDISSETGLKILIPIVNPQITFEVHSFLCKADMLKKLPSRLKAYRNWLPNDWGIVILIDRDDDDCRILKDKLNSIAMEAGFDQRALTTCGKPQLANRIAVEEFEAWYFGDWQAVRMAYPRVGVKIPKKSKYRDPDAIRNTWETLERILKKAGYFKTGLRKIELAENVCPWMRPSSNTSYSFGVFRDSVIKFAE